MYLQLYSINISGANICDLVVEKRQDMSDDSTWTVEYRSNFDTNATWYHVVNGHSKEVINSYQFSLLRTLLISGKISKLTRRHLTVENNGEYKCVAANVHCFKSVSYNVISYGIMLLLYCFFY